MGVWDQALEQWTLRASSSHCWLDPVSPWCLPHHIFVWWWGWDHPTGDLIPTCCLPNGWATPTQLVPPAHLFLLPVSFTPCCCKHIKEEWILVVSVQPGHQPKDDNYTQVISSPFQHFVSAFEWTVNRCSVIVMLSGLANKGRILNLALEAKLKSLGIAASHHSWNNWPTGQKFQPHCWGPEGIWTL